MQPNHKLALGVVGGTVIGIAADTYAHGLAIYLDEIHLLPAALAGSTALVVGATAAVALYHCLKGVDVWSIYPPESTLIAPKIFESIDPIETKLLEAEGVTGTAAQHHKVLLPQGEFYDLAGAIQRRQAAKRRR